MTLRLVVRARGRRQLLVELVGLAATRRTTSSKSAHGDAAFRPDAGDTQLDGLAGRDRER
jgi:hypothetical protein